MINHINLKWDITIDGEQFSETISDDSLQTYADIDRFVRTVAHHIRAVLDTKLDEERKGK